LRVYSVSNNPVFSLSQEFAFVKSKKYVFFCLFLLNGHKQGKVIYAIINDASRWVFVWSYEVANAGNTVDFIRNVIKRALFIILKIRTDQRKEFKFKINKLIDLAIVIDNVCPIKIKLIKQNKKYLQTKKERMSHNL